MMRNGTRVCKASMTLQMVPRVRRAREKTIRKQGDTGKALIVCISPFRLILSKEAEKPGKRETRKTKHRAPQLFPRAGLQWAREGAGGLLGWLGWLSWLAGTGSTPSWWATGRVQAARLPLATSLPCKSWYAFPVHCIWIPPTESCVLERYSFWGGGVIPIKERTREIEGGSCL